MVSGHPKSTGILRVNGLSMGPRIWGVTAIGGTNEHSHDWRKCVRLLSKEDEAHQ